jgi:hypothetical protein
MSNIIKFEINGTTNAEQVTDRVKKSVSALEKNINGINERFKSFGKDLFLSFAAPMVILNTVMNQISSFIERSKQEVKDIRDFAATSNSPYLDPKTKYLANLRVATDRERMERGMAPKATNEEYAYFLMNDPRSRQVLEVAGIGANLKALVAGIFSSGDEGAAKSLAANPEIKSAIDSIIEKAARDAAAKEQTGKEDRTFKSPQGLNAVVGVGANPTLEAMTQQLEEQRKQTALLEQIAQGSPPKDFTKTDK